MPFLYFIVLFCFNCFTQPSRFRVPGRIVWDQPADRLVVEALEGGSHQLVDRANVSPDGQFELIVTSESVTYEIRVLTLHGETVKSDYINVRAHVPIEIRLPSARARPNPAGPISARHLMHKPLKAAQKLATQADRFLASGDVPHSIEQLRAAVAADPEWFEVWNNLGTRLLVANQPEPAVEAFQHAVAIDPSAGAAQTNLAISLLRLKRPVEAEVAARQALRLQPDSQKAAYATGLALAQQSKEIPEAIKLLEKAGTLLPVAYLSEAHLQCGAQQWKTCAASLKNFLKTPATGLHPSVQDWLSQVESQQLAR